jgi:hypothetical protein
MPFYKLLRKADGF